MIYPVDSAIQPLNNRGQISNILATYCTVNMYGIYKPLGKLTQEGENTRGGEDVFPNSLTAQVFKQA